MENKSITTEKRRFVRLDSIFPVEFQFFDPITKEPKSSWFQGFTANISKGGMGLNAPAIDEDVLQVLKNNQTNLKLNLRIHIPVFGTPVTCVANVAWVKREEEGHLGPYAIGLQYEDISEEDSQRIMRVVSFKATFPRFALAAIIILFLSFGISAYYNWRLFSGNKKLVEGMVEAVRDFKLAKEELEDIRNGKNLLEAKLAESTVRIKSTRGALTKKIESLEKDLSKLRKEGSVQLNMREAEITELKSAMYKLEQEKEQLIQKIGETQAKEDVAMMKLDEIGERKGVLEKANFEKMYQWLKIHQNRRTGLLSSFEGDGQISDQAFTYDQALAAITFTYFKDYGLAKEIFDFYLTKAKKGEVFYNGYYASTGEPSEYIIHSGPNLWLGIAVLNYTRMSADTKYLPIAESIANRIMKLQAEDSEGGLRGGQDVGWYATEHNLDGFSFFDMFYSMTQNSKYKRSADTILAWLKNHTYDHPEVPIKRGKGDSTIATDTYAWSIAALGVKRLLDMGMNPEDIMNFAEENCGITVDYQRPGGMFVKVKGFDFAKARNVARGGVVSCEWSAQMVLSYKILGKYFASLGNADKAKKYQDKANEYLEELTKMIVSSPSRTGQGQGCLPYASCDYVDTGHGWMTPKGKNTGSVSSTAYAIFAYYGFNPLRPQE